MKSLVAFLKPLVLLHFGLGALVLISGCSSPSGKIPANLTVDRTPGSLAPGDVLRFSYLGDPTLNQTQRVRADGKVSLASIGEVTAAGKRLGQFQTELSQAYKPHLKNPEVVVWLEASNVSVTVTGAVNRPGEIAIERPITLFEAIQKAGGLSNLADDHKVTVVRTAGNQHYSQTFDMSGIRTGQSIPVFYLRPYDSVQVQERFF
jgi:protein involved in polysaccharide export with SLBB domain